MKKIPDGSEACNILVGEMDCLKYQITAFVRLTEARSIGDLTEVPLPTKFIFLLLGPPGSHNKNVEMGRSMSTMMVDEVFATFLFYQIFKLFLMVKIPILAESLNSCNTSIDFALLYSQVFREVAYRAKSRQDILSGIDEFLDQVTVLPPGEWDPKIRIEPPDKVPSQVIIIGLS